MKIISNRRWSADEETAEKIRQWLIDNGGNEDKEIKNEHEKWRVRYSDATCTYYKKGTVYITDSNDGALNEVHNFIESLLGSKFILPSRDCLIGFDETGKGEVFGHVILAGALIPKSIYNDIEKIIGVADTKVSHDVKYWDNIFNKIDFFKPKGLDFVIEKIPPWHFDRFNVNKLLDISYQRLLLLLSQKIDLSKTRIVFDDYGIGHGLGRYLESLRNKSVEIIKTNKADGKYLECRVASLISKREQQKVLEAISSNPEFQIPGKLLGSGNTSDPKTVQWLKEWHQLKKDWPWFVKRSFNTIREIEGIKTKPKKIIPPINDHLLSKGFREKFEKGELNIESLSVVCPCGAVSKSIKLIVKADYVVPICVNCKNELNNAALTLRYYCGRILPDNSVITRGFISKDLEKARFFEGFLFLINPTLRHESDSPGGKKEFERLARFTSIGRIRMEEIGSILDPQKHANIERDELMMKDAAENNAIFLTGDNQTKGIAQAKGIFTIEI